MHVPVLFRVRVAEIGRRQKQQHIHRVDGISIGLEAWVGFDRQKWQKGCGRLRQNTGYVLDVSLTSKAIFHFRNLLS